jgi:hypothetical protein
VKIVEEIPIFEVANASRLPPINAALDDIRAAIATITWPKKRGNSKFIIFPGVKGDKKKGIKDTSNGVKPIKDAFVLHLKGKGWEPEQRVALATGLPAGKVDAIKLAAGRPDCVAEWETGNISSSHRALNKMVLAIRDAGTRLGVLVLPSRNFYRHLTDRVGNVDELRPYFPLWRDLAPTHTSALYVFVVEHDAVDKRVPRIRKGTDGRALV